MARMETIGRVIRGITGAVLITGGIIDSSWIVLPGLFLMMSAAAGTCGFGVKGSCRMPPQPVKEKNSNE